MRSSDWSSDVCSSDLSAKIMSEVNTLLIGRNRLFLEGLKSLLRGSAFDTKQEVSSVAELDLFDEDDAPELILNEQIGRASGRERVCQYVSLSVDAVTLKKKMNRYNE